MIAGLRGSLLSHDALACGAPAPDPADEPHQRSLLRWNAEVARDGGPAWTARTVFDRIAVPFSKTLGFDVVPMRGDANTCRAVVQVDGAIVAVVAAFAWGQDPGMTWRESVRAGIGTGTRWCYCFSGPTLRIYDAQRTHSRRFAEVDLAILCSDPGTLRVLWPLLSSAATLDEAVRRSDRHRAAVRESLQLGVHDALIQLTQAFATATRRRHGSHPPPGLLDESLVVIYRILFLLFAEARGLVPAWHPVFREGYTIEALREPVERLDRPRGVWEALQAIARLAHRGCTAGTLRVPPFNGRLFSPAHAPLADSAPLDDSAVGRALLALTTRRTPAGRERITYGDLGVEQLGGVYERVLDYDLGVDEHGHPALVRGGTRKSTGTFYTPRPLTEYLVRRTLAPLVTDATPERILSLRILDPAMGSGAFLVAACRYLASAYEAALLRAGGLTSADLSDADRAGFRRIIAQRCLFGVDLNPMSVQLARLSLWLTTLCGDRPLTFFDHHLRVGNSLVGASLADVRQREPGRRTSRRPLPLLDADGLEAAVGHAVSCRERLRDDLEDTLDQIRAKERTFAELVAPGAPLSRWKAVADLWCAGWFEGRTRKVSRAALNALLDDVSGRYTTLAEHVRADLLALGASSARSCRFFHWELEFPEIFHGANGDALADPGFDAILGNPPWEMLRGDLGDGDARRRAADAGSALTRFSRDSGIYRLQGGGHANLYQLFLERALGLVRRGGRIGFVLPSGFATDHGGAALRRHVLRSTTVDTFTMVDNKEGLFPVHRALKFVLLTLCNGPLDRHVEATRTLPLRCGLRAATDFDRLPDMGGDPADVPASLSLIEQLSGDQLAIPELRTAMDARLAAHLGFGFPAAGAREGWGLEFGRELNATDDRTLFNRDSTGLPVIGGKHIQPFTVNFDGVESHIDADAAARVLGRRPFESPRLAYRDVASSTNKLTLIAAVLPADVVTTHTLFCLKTPLDEDAQHFLAGMFNSFAANYLVRLRVTTHVTVAIVERMPLPKPERTSADFRTIARCARLLSDQPGDVPAYARLQAAAARLYGLDRNGLAHILETFPLVEPNIRSAALAAFAGV
ncbi:MAG TPA: N-6 DNA methylase [Vicinamibacterales bacterium]